MKMKMKMKIKKKRSEKRSEKKEEERIFYNLYTYFQANGYDSKNIYGVYKYNNTVNFEVPTIVIGGISFEKKVRYVNL